MENSKYIFEIFEDSKPLKDLSNLTELLYGTRKENPFFSIVIPTFKRNDLLCYAINSAINQTTNVPYEILVLDNNDDKEDFSCLEKIKKHFKGDEVCYFKNKENLGMTGNWNLGLNVARGKWLVILHDDDKLHSNYLEVMNIIVNKRPDVGIVSCLHEVIHDEDIKGIENKKENVSSEIRCFDVDLINVYIQHDLHVCGLLVNREKAISIGGFDDKWYPSSDYVFEVKMVEKYKGVLCHSSLASYRILNNESMKPDVASKFATIIYKAQLELNKKYKFLPESIDKLYREAALYQYEKEILNDWGKNEQAFKNIQNEFDNWHTQYGVSKPSKIVNSLFYRFRKVLYRRFNKKNIFIIQKGI